MCFMLHKTHRHLGEDILNIVIKYWVKKMMLFLVKMDSSQC